MLSDVVGAHCTGGHAERASDCKCLTVPVESPHSIKFGASRHVLCHHYLSHRRRALTMLSAHVHSRKHPAHRGAGVRLRSAYSWTVSWGYTILEVAVAEESKTYSIMDSV